MTEPDEQMNDGRATTAAARNEIGGAFRNDWQGRATNFHDVASGRFHDSAGHPIRREAFPYGRCVTCGKKTHRTPADEDWTVADSHWAEDGGRPRFFCSNRCRQQAWRLRRKNGDEWWRHQPWRLEWDQQLAEKLREAKAEQEAQAAAWRLREQALAAMSPEARAQALQVERDSWREDAARMREQMDRTSRQNKRAAAQTYHRIMGGLDGKHLEGGNPSDDRRIVKLLDHAVACESETEAATFFDKARRLWHAGEGAA